jgi:hypothetical protein
MRRWLACVWLSAPAACAQQVPDRGYSPAIARPMYARGAGPSVCVDEAHANFHTLGGRFFACGELLRRDGYRVKSNTVKFDAPMPGSCAVLVISNARAQMRSADSPSAFAAGEITAVHAWVERGGALLLIADHMPFGGAASRLAGAFEVQFNDSFAMRDPDSEAPDLFQLADRTLRAHAITRGRTGLEAVTRVRTFTGQAFRAPRAQPLPVFPAGYVGLTPEDPWKFDAHTPRVPIAGWLQGAVQAEQNFQLVLNLLHWLTGTL